MYAWPKLFNFLAAKYDVETILLGTLTLGCASHAYMLQSVWKDETRLLAAFVLFEVSVGLYFPAMGTIKSKVVPEECRTTIYNLYRIPLNMVVVLGLYFKASPPETLATTTTLLTVGVCLSLALTRSCFDEKKAQYTSVIGDHDAEIGRREVHP